MDLKKLENTYSEKRLMTSMDHENILKEISHFENNNYICMVTELMDDDVRDMKKKMPELMKEEQARHIF